MKPLNRSTRNKMLGGICAGVGEHYDVDPSIVRLIWIVITLLSIGIGVIIYIVAWIIVPEDTGNSTPSSGNNSEKT